MHYLITGGAGFIGSHLTELLLKDNHQVTIIDNLSTGSIENLENVIKSTNLTFIEDDVITCPNLDDIIKDVDFVFHLAAAVGVELVVNDPVQTIETNVHGTENILKSAAKYNKKILIASTSEVYGKSSKEEFSETDDLIIGSSTFSRWSYACSKLLDEFYAMAYHRSFNTSVIVVRLFNTVGPRQIGRYGMVVPRLINQAIKNDDITVYGDGNQSRCFCHVFDTIKALKGLSETNEDVFGKIFNIGNVNSITILELANKIKSQLQSSSKIKFIPYNEAYEKGFEDMRRRKPSIATIQKTLDWQPQLSLEQIISDIVTFKNKKKV